MVINLAGNDGEVETCCSVCHNFERTSLQKENATKFGELGAEAFHSYDRAP